VAVTSTHSLTSPLQTATMIYSTYKLTATYLRPESLRIKNYCRWYSKFDLYGDSPVPTKKQRFVPTSGTYPKGFLVGSAHIGIKPESKSQPDLVLIASEKASCGAAVLTRNEFAAPSVTVTRELIRKTGGHGLRGVIANSWCANLLTGKAGLEDTVAMSKEADKYVSGGESKDRESSVMVMHTGTGGQRYIPKPHQQRNGTKYLRRLPMDKIIGNIPKICQDMGTSHSHWLNAAWGICTTDTFPKLASRTFTLPSSPNTAFSIAGITKGAGMIHPNMATTLGIICTDAPLTAPALQQLLSTAADKSYNCISIEGDTSTNDMVAMLANGAAGGIEIGFDPAASTQSEDFVSFQRTLIEFMADLAKLVVRDGEGATKFITIRVRGAPSYPAGKHIASVIARSVLAKTAIYGNNPNWGEMMVALGYSLIGTEYSGKGIIVPEMTSISLVPVNGSTELKFLDMGVPGKVDEIEAKNVLEQEDIEVVVDLRDDGEGSRNDAEEATYWTCDITHEFVTINGDFRT